MGISLRGAHSLILQVKKIKWSAYKMRLDHSVEKHFNQLTMFPNLSGKERLVKIFQFLVVYSVFVIATYYLVSMFFGMGSEV